MKKLNGNNVHLHNHTSRGSLLDSTLTIKQMISFAKENGQSAIAITNHGKMHDYINFYKACKKENIKPIIGCEIYEVEDLNNEETKSNRYHLVLLVKNQKGLQNLFKIISDAHTKFFYYRPIIDLKYIKENNLGEGLICLTACQAGRFSKMAIDKLDINNYYNNLNNIFDNTYIELQSHSTESQIIANKHIFNVIQKYQLPYVITCDSHMLSEEDQEVHGIFVEINQDRDVGESYKDCYLQNNIEIHNIMDTQIGKENVNIALNNNFNISGMIEEINIGLDNTYQMPDISKHMPKQFKNIEEWYDFLIEEGFKKRGHHLKSKEFQQARRDRLLLEKPVLKELRYLDYFIMCYMLLEECRKRQIPIGLSRGSSAGCQSLYYLNITQLDSIKWDLDFSRFANLGRQQMADIDLDISKKYRKEIINIARDLFGIENVCPICTFNTMSTKVAIRDIGKVLNDKRIYDIPYIIRNEVAKMIPTINTLNDLGEAEEKETLMRDILFQNKKLKKYYEKYPKWFKYVMKLEGLPKSLGQHAAGVIIAPKPIIEYCPMCLNSDKESMLQLEMHNAMDDLSLIKMDFLGLKTLDIIDDTLKLCNKSWADIHIDNIDLDDKKIFENIYKNNNTNNVFQMESYEAMQMCSSCNTDNIEDIIAVNAFNRPGTKEGFSDYKKNKLNPNKVKVIHEDLKEIFIKSHYVLLYQEQALELFRYAGFPEEEIDIARRAIGHKEIETMKALKIKFSNGLNKKSWSKEQIEKIWALMLKQAEYSFNRSHACAYALTSYQTAWLKYYFPLEFICACLNNDIDNYEKITSIINNAQHMNIKILPPNINKSSRIYTIDKNNNVILFGLNGIKGLGQSAVKSILEIRPFNNFEDMIHKIDKSKVGINKIVALIKSGALGQKKNGNMKQLFEHYFYTNLPKFKLVQNVTPKDLKQKCNIEISNKEKNYKQKRTDIYNKWKKQQYDIDVKQKYEKEKNIFVQKYMQKNDLWEFETLSMFITKNPFEKVIKYMPDFDSVENGSQISVLGIIFDIDLKKDKNGQQYAFVKFYNGENNIELIFWSFQYARYRKGIYKQSKIVVKGEKEDNKIYVNEVKPYKLWLKEKGLLNGKY